jgi:hypothetical protein
MKRNILLKITVLSLLIGLAGACSSAQNQNTAVISNAGKPAESVAATNSEADHKSDDEIPAAIKAAFPGAQSFSKQHKDIPANSIAAIEKDAGGKVAETDHHSFLAFQMKDGKRTQIGAATIAQAGGRDVVIVYQSAGGVPTISEVRADGVAADFLKQFTGKDHDDKFQIGADIKTNGAEETTAKAIAQAVRIDALTMQTLYGAAHTH